jgi:hypothetical protein
MEHAMPLLDHFHGQLDDIYTWEAIHGGWAACIVADLNRKLPPNFTAIDRQRFGAELEIDVATFERAFDGDRASGGSGGTALLEAPSYAPPVVRRSIAAGFPDIVEIRVFLRDGGSRLVGAIEIVSPGNKDRPTERQAFVAKCLSYLKDGVSLIIVDVVTTRRANLHDELMKMLDESGESDDLAGVPLYVSAYRPVVRSEQGEIDLWVERLAVGLKLPIMPLRLTGDLFVPVDLESTYQECCRDRRLI